MIVVVPMAGRGSRFTSAGIETPKPLIEVAGKPMILWALESLANLQFSKIVFVILAEHEKHFNVVQLLQHYKGWNTSFVIIDKVTEGQLCTVLEASDHFNTDEDILIAACDSLIVSNIEADLLAARRACDGLISVINLPGEHWSFARTDADGNVVEVAEKRRISDNCSTGLYYFSSCAILLQYGNELIDRNERTRNEFFVIPVYQKMIDDGLVVKVSMASAMWDMGNPDAKRYFENNFKNQTSDHD
jgi:UDP-N-acetylglucosamine diphosphorylase / glucose-1-phosphate thymidylyltransferase / UDP-N-acetylgalactosamine diphosphorylase / glucosamine-1-phosphate N-acetyltransferase / galactosamine-1-phosphate N-acetyltransferase